MKITRSSQVDWVDALQRGKFSQRRKPLGGAKMQASLYELPPGKKSFPLHAHAITEEAMFVVSGRAQVRTLEGLSEIGPGDFVSFPPGGPAHQVVNHGPEPLTYLAISVNMAGADIVEYPDSGKIACSQGSYPTGKRFLFKTGDAVDYFDGEPDAVS
ncbi:MAG: cupin domain-containing protein [Deltaproteobacteria bacterium]|nr:cupin domain-containing protein [Deltaproteobacteria bacterium]